jgi:hypothetical protein
MLPAASDRVGVHATEVLAVGRFVMLCQKELDRPEAQKYGRAGRVRDRDGASVMPSGPSAEQRVPLGALNRQREHVLEAVEGLASNDLDIR